MPKTIEAKESDKYQDWCVQNAVDTLIRAEEIKQDPKMMGLVQKELDKRKEALNKLGGSLPKKKSQAETLYNKEKK